MTGPKLSAAPSHNRDVALMSSHTASNNSRCAQPDLRGHMAQRAGDAIPVHIVIAFHHSFFSRSSYSRAVLSFIQLLEGPVALVSAGTTSRTVQPAWE